MTRTCVAIFCEVDGDLPTDTPRRANDERDLFVGLGHGGDSDTVNCKGVVA